MDDKKRNSTSSELHFDLDKNINKTVEEGKETTTHTSKDAEKQNNFSAKDTGQNNSLFDEIIKSNEEIKKEMEDDKCTYSLNNINYKVIISIMIAVLVLFFSIFVGVFLLNYLNEEDTQTSDSKLNTEENIEHEENPKDIVTDKAMEVINRSISKKEKMNIPLTIKKGEYESLKYHNSFLDIKFEYPSYWVENYTFQVKDTDENVQNVVLLTHPSDKEVLDNMRISIEYLDKSITSKEYIRQTEERMYDIFPELQIVNTGELTVSGREAPSRIYIWVTEEELEKSQFPQEWNRIQQYQIYVAGQTKIYIITFTTTVEDFSKNYEKYERIISTLELGM